MALYSVTRGLHREDQPAAIAAAHTHIGQAHFAGSGPVGRTCRECHHWAWSAQVDGWSTFAGPNPARCVQYKMLMRAWGRKVPHSAFACRHFDLRENEIPLVRPGRGL